MTVPPPLTALGAFPIGLHGFYHCRPVGRRSRENKGSQNCSVAFWFILNRKEKSNKEAPAPKHNSSKHLSSGYRWLSRAFTRKQLSPLLPPFSLYFFGFKDLWKVNRIFFTFISDF